ncbi:FAD-binding protein [Hellea sp.]|nr:FAD-binding protein [Hellea sp.]
MPSIHKALFLKSADALNSVLREGISTGLSSSELSIVWDAADTINLIIASLTAVKEEASSDRLLKFIDLYIRHNSNKKAYQLKRSELCLAVSNLLGSLHLLVLTDDDDDDDDDAADDDDDLVIDSIEKQTDIDNDLRSVLLASNVEETPNCYILGCFEDKKTFLTQQERAIWLSTAILKFWRGSTAPRVAVIGSGIAGVTATACLSTGGAEVVLIEKSDELIPLQRRNDTRYIHPHLYDWPKPSSLSSDARLPILNWVADFADKVVAQIEDEFYSIVDENGNIEIEKSFKVTGVKPHSGNARSPKFAISGKSKEPLMGFDVVIYAIGFGVELPKFSHVPVLGYWDNTPLHASGLFDENMKGNILVSGCGDGALVDVLRGRLRDFNHSEILELIPELQDEGIKTKLLDIEREAISEKITVRRGQFIFSPNYYKILKDIKLSTEIKKLLHPAYNITFNSRRPGKYKLGSSILNRVLVQIFISNGLVNFREKDIESDNVTAVTINGRSGYNVKWVDEEEFFDKILLRYGVDSSAHFERSFPAVFDSCGEIQERQSRLRLIKQASFNLYNELRDIRLKWVS